MSGRGGRSRRGRSFRKRRVSAAPARSPLGPESPPGAPSYQSSRLHPPLSAAQQRVVTAMMNQGKTGESAFFAINRQRQLAAAERRAVQEKSAADGSAAGASSPRALGPALAPLHVGRPRGPCLPDTCDNRIAMEAAPRGDVVDVDVSAFELVSQRAAQGGSKPRGGCRVEGAEVLLAEAARYLAGVEVPVGNTGQGRGADGVEQIENEARAALVSSAESLARLVARREGEVARERAAPGRAGEMPVPKRPRLQPGEPIEIDSSDADDVAPAPGPTDDGRETQAAGGLMSTLQWVDALAPEHHSQVCGNPESARRLRDWLAGWAQRIDREAGEGGDGGATSKGSRNTEGRSGKRARRSGRVAEDFDELIGNYTEETLCQGAILVYGPPGVGKSATVTSCAQELGFQTLEVNAGSERTGAHLNKFIGEATKSRRLPGKGSDRGPSATTALADMFSDAAVGKGKRKGAGLESRGDKGRGSRTVLVLEEVDVLADEDRGFSAALGQLIMETKRPIILTSSVPRPACVPAGVRVEAIRFGRVAEEDIVRLLVAATIALRATASFQALREIAAASNGDLRRAVATAQVWLQKPAAVAQAVGSPRSPSGFLTAPAVSGDVVDEALGSIARICLSPGRVPVLSTSGRAVDAPSGGGVLSRVHDECTGRLLGLMCSTSAGRSSDRTGKGGLLLAPARGGLVAGDLERTCGVRLGDLCDSRAPARGRLCSTVDRDVPVVARETPLRAEAGVAATVMTGSPWSDTIEDPDTPLTAGKQPEDSTEELAQPVLDTSHATPSTPGNRQQVATCSSDERSDSGSEERGAVDVVASLLPSSRATATARCRITHREVMLAVLGEPVPGPRASPACGHSGGDREVPSGAADLGTLADCLDSLSCCDLLKCGRPDIVDMAFPLPAARHRPAFAGMGAAPASSTSISAGAGGNFLATALGHSVAAPGGLEALLLAGGGVLDVDDEVSPWGRASDGAEPRCQVGAAQTLHDEAAECAASLALAVATAGMDGVKGAEPQHPGSDASGAAVGIEAVASGPHSSAHVLARQIESVSLLHRAAALVAPRAALEGPMPVLDRAMGLVKIAGVLSAQDDEAGQGEDPGPPGPPCHPWGAVATRLTHPPCPCFPQDPSEGAPSGGPPASKLWVPCS